MKGRAHAAFGGDQPGFAIWGEGYWPLQYYDGMVGRLYAIQGDQLWECTATLVGPSVILTAAHCVFDTNSGQYYPSFVFIPGQYGNSFPLGQWSGRTPYMWTDYANSPSVSNDYAFLTLQTTNGWHLGDLTGWRGILANSTANRVLSIGYPATGVFGKYCDSGSNSCYQWACYSPLGWQVQDDPNGSEIGVGCNTNHGASGGPWFEPYGNGWLIASNLSTIVTFPPDPGYSTNQWGPYYDDNTLSLLTYAQANG